MSLTILRAIRRKSSIVKVLDLLQRGISRGYEQSSLPIVWNRLLIVVPPTKKQVDKDGLAFL